MFGVSVGEVAEAVAPAEGGVEGASDGAHVGPAKIDVEVGSHGGAAGGLDGFAGDVDADDVVAAAGEFEGVAAGAAWDVEDGGAGFFAELALEVIDFGGGGNVLDEFAPEFDGDAFEKGLEPVRVGRRGRVSGGCAGRFDSFG